MAKSRIWVKEAEKKEIEMDKWLTRYKVNGIILASLLMIMSISLIFSIIYDIPVIKDIVTYISLIITPYVFLTLNMRKQYFNAESDYQKYTAGHAWKPKKKSSAERKKDVKYSITLFE